MTCLLFDRVNWSNFECTPHQPPTTSIIIIRVETRIVLAMSQSQRETLTNWPFRYCHHFAHQVNDIHQTLLDPLCPHQMHQRFQSNSLPFPTNFNNTWMVDFYWKSVLVDWLIWFDWFLFSFNWFNATTKQNQWCWWCDVYACMMM